MFEFDGRRVRNEPSPWDGPHIYLTKLVILRSRNKKKKNKVWKPYIEYPPLIVPDGRMPR